MPYASSSVMMLRTDGEGWLKKLDAAVRKAMYESAALFLREVQKHVPTYTGMARGSLLPLAKYLNSKGVRNRVSIPITPVKTRQSLYLMSRGQNIDAGADRGTFEFVDNGNGRFIFRFNAGVEHYKINDANAVTNFPLIHPTPWGSFPAGAERANLYLRNQAKKLPRLEFKPFKVSVGRSRKTF